MYIAGLDVGTTGCKLTVFDESGRRVAAAYRDYPVRRATSGHEVDGAAVMDGVYGVLTELSQYDIAAIGVTSFGETFVLTDAAGEPLAASMLYTDTRGKEECAALTEKLGADKITRITGLYPHEMYSLAKLVWMKDHRPEVFGKAARCLLIEDFVVFRLSGAAQISYSLATRTMAFDLQKLDWSDEILTAAGIDKTLFSRPVPMGTPAGTVTAETAARTGLSRKCLIVTAAHDQVAAATGAGAFDGSMAVDGAGTVECLTPVYDRMPDPAAMARGRFPVVPHVVPGKYVAYAFTYTGGALMQWCVDTLAKAEKAEAEAKGVSVHRLLEAQYGRDEPTGLLVLPHFAGAATPYMDIGSKGAILGLTAATDVPTLYRACMEGVAYEMRVNYEALAGTGVQFTGLNATGGGAKSKIWMQIKADVLDLPITALETSDAGTVGCAMLTGVAVGLFKNLDEAAAVMVTPTETYYPRADYHKKYMEIYERYRCVYRAVRPLV